MIDWNTFILAADQGGVLLGWLLAIPVLWTWWTVTFGARRRQRRQLDAIRKSPGHRPGILVVDLLIGKDVRAAVENFCASQEALKDIPADRIHFIARDQALTPEDTPKLIEDIRRAHGELIRAGVDKIHYFHAGIGIAAALVGAELGNGAQVVLYHHTPGEYINFGPLRLPYGT